MWKLPLREEFEVVYIKEKSSTKESDFLLYPFLLETVVSGLKIF
jgi:hypothetical protein